MSRTGIGMKVARAFFLLGVGWLAGATAQTCTTGSKAVAISSGSTHACALLDDATVKCWGYNSAGALGLGDNSDRGDNTNEMGTNLPSANLGAGRTAMAVSAGARHTCALLDDATLKCWGENAGNGQLGLGYSSNLGFEANGMGTNLPSVDLGAGRTAVAVSSGGQHTCTLLDDATIKCWGWNLNGQLGLGDTSNRGDRANEMGTNLLSVDLGAGRTAVAVSARGHTSCALLDDATVKCWGYNGNGQLGLGDNFNRGDDADEMGANLPSVDLGAGRTAVAVSVGKKHTCALLDDATVKCWGSNVYGQLGLGVDTNQGDEAYGPCPPREIEMGTNLTSIDLGPGRTAISVCAGVDHTCALLDDATVKCWGNNDDGQLGLGDTLNRGDDANGSCPPSSTIASLVPPPVLTLGSPRAEMGANLPPVDLGAGRTAVAVSPGASQTCALLDDATVKCWGLNFNGQLGLGDTSNRGNSANEMGEHLPAVVFCGCSVGATITVVSMEGNTSMSSCACPARFTGDAAASGGSCAACAPGTYKSVMGSAVCTSCSTNAVSAEGSISCGCSAGFTGDAASGGSCTACTAGTYKSGMGTKACSLCPVGKYTATAGTADCSACPSGSSASVTGSMAVTACICSVGYAGGDGGPCTGCGAGRYKNATGSAACAACPSGSFASGASSRACTSCGANTASAEGSTASSSCGCAPGFWGDLIAEEICTACPTGTYKDSGGAAKCSSCPGETPQSVPGSAAAGDCVAAISFITFSVRVQMNRAEFEVVATEAAYISGVAAALGVAETSVSIVSVEEQSTGRRRKLLLTSVVVETSVVVSAENAEAVAARITTDNFNSALSSAGIFVDEVSGISTVTETAALSAWGIVGIVIAVAAVVALVGAVVWYRRQSRASADESSGGALRNFTDATEEAASEDLVDMVAAAVKEVWSEVRANNTGKFSPLVLGKFDEATPALEDFLLVGARSKEHLANMAGGEFAIVSEVEKLVASVRDRVAPENSSKGGVGARDEPAGSPTDTHGDCLDPSTELSEEDKTLLEQAQQLSECLGYVLHQEAGSSGIVFDNGGLKRDCGKDGNLLPSREIVDCVTGQKRGMRFDDFVDHPSARLVGLRREQVLALRLYTTIAFKSINSPLRDQSCNTEGRAHPLPVTVAHILKAVQQLHKGGGNEATAHDSVDLYRGLAGCCFSPEFLAKGGTCTELVPMSTTRDLKVALQYATSESAVILRLRTRGLMCRGVDIAFLSCFPAESEVLFPPLTYLGPMCEQDENGVEQPKAPRVVRVGAATFTIVDVQPQK